jgi:hypothetical protein
MSVEEMEVIITTLGQKIILHPVTVYVKWCLPQYQVLQE